ncbi:hypothetical protein KEM52_003304 [Ascosphaera acerosa]|nr:hypothetical protein KEM52_003304 [Ascosphaera acerosa]
MDICTILPGLDVSRFAPELRAVEDARITTKDLLVSDALEIARRARLAVLDVRRLVNHVLDGLHRDLGFSRSEAGASDEDHEHHDTTPRTGQAATEAEVCSPHHHLDISFISTLDYLIDDALHGGVPTRYLTEVAGESASGKTQFLLQLLLSVQLPPPYGLSKNALYLSTESELPTPRLVQLLESHPAYAAFADSPDRPSLDNIFTVTAVDLEAQNHLLEFQVPVMVERHNIGLVVIDSIAANYRDELSSQDSSTLLERAWQLKQLGHALQMLAVQRNIAIVASNQVYDHWTDLSVADDPLRPGPAEPSPTATPRTRPSGTGLDLVTNSSPAMPTTPVTPSSRHGMTASDMPPDSHSAPVTPSHPTSTNFDGHQTLSQCDPPVEVPPLATALSLEYQQPFFAGIGDADGESLKAPALGVVWTNQVACRIILSKEEFLVPRANVMPAPQSLPASTHAAPPDPDDQPLLVQEPDKAPQRSNGSSTGCESAVALACAEPSDSPSEDYYETVRRRFLRVIFSPWAPSHLSSYECTIDNRQPFLKYDIRDTGLHGVT